MKYLLITATVILALLFFFWKDVEDILPVNALSTDKGKNRSKAKDHGKTEVEILQKWDLPSSLREVSGIAWLDGERFAAVQDELGTVFIYNTTTKSIEKQISFAETGDFEGLTIANNKLYVASADGKIYEIDQENNNAIKQYSTTLTAKNNVEGFCYDVSSGKLLLAVKDRDPNSKQYKGIYAFDLKEHVFSPQPVYKIEMEDPVFDGKKKKEIMPAAIGIHPVTQNIYVADGPNSRLLILDRKSKILKLIDLGKEFSQPEGISFSPSGDLYISNEGTRDPGNILKVRITEN
jgi:DNA-binding beta-propeller fold protein YncE